MSDNEYTGLNYTKTALLVYWALSKTIDVFNFHISSASSCDEASIKEMQRLKIECKNALIAHSVGFYLTINGTMGHLKAIDAISSEAGQPPGGIVRSIRGFWLLYLMGNNELAKLQQSGD